MLLKYNLTLGIRRYFNTSVCNGFTKNESHSSTRVAAEKRFETKINHVARASNEFLTRQLDFGTKIVAKKPSKNDDFVKEGASFYYWNRTRASATTPATEHQTKCHLKINFYVIETILRSPFLVQIIQCWVSAIQLSCNERR